LGKKELFLPRFPRQILSWGQAVSLNWRFLPDLFNLLPQKPLLGGFHRGLGWDLKEIGGRKGLAVKFFKGDIGWLKFPKKEGLGQNWPLLGGFWEEPFRTYVLIGYTEGGFPNFWGQGTGIWGEPFFLPKKGGS